MNGKCQMLKDGVCMGNRNLRRRKNMVEDCKKCGCQKREPIRKDK